MHCWWIYLCMYRFYPTYSMLAHSLSNTERFWNKYKQHLLINTSTMVVNRKQPVAPVPLVQSRSTSQQHIVARKKQPKHTSNGIDVRFLVRQHMFFLLNKYHSLITHLQRVQIWNWNRNRDRDRERFNLVFVPRISKKLIYFCRNICETDSLSGLCLSSSFTLFSSVHHIQQHFKNPNPISYVASNQITKLIFSTHSSYLHSNVPSRSPILSQNLTSHKSTPTSSHTSHQSSRSHLLSSPTSYRLPAQPSVFGKLL